MNLGGMMHNTMQQIAVKNSHAWLLLHVPWNFGTFHDSLGPRPILSGNVRNSHYGLTWWHDAVYHEVGHYFELSRSANIRISWSRPAEGAVVLGTSCIVYYIVVYKDLRSLFKLNLIEQKLSFNLHCRETILNSESMSRFAIVINRLFPCSHYYSIRLFAHLNTK